MIIVHVSVKIEDEQDLKKSFIFWEFKVLQKGKYIAT